jgi:UDP-GlcNAc:undecaprenyl-phosphate GlcNAc-1-phosphate transferase
MGFFENEFLVKNLSSVLGIVFIAFIISFLITPFIGRLAKKVGAIDLPARLRRVTERGYASRLHTNPYPKLGGLAMFIAMGIVGFLILAFSEGYQNIGSYSGIAFGVIIIVILGFIDDVYEVSGSIQLFFQFVAAFVLVLAGISINSVSLLGTTISFNWFSTLIELGDFKFTLVFPGAIITIIWVVGLINVINWVGGVDALNGVVSSIASATMLLLVLANGNISLSILIAIHLGSILGVLPYNYNPGKIMYGSIGDYLNGYLLAVFAVLGGVRWSATIILLALPIIDGMYVLYTRLQKFPETRKNPLKLLSVSGYNHLHHRLLASGFSKKMVVLIEGAIMLMISWVVIFFSDINFEYIKVITGLIFLLVVFIIIAVLVKRAERQNRFKSAVQVAEEELKGNAEKDQSEVVVKMVFKDKEEEEKDEKFIY